MNTNSKKPKVSVIMSAYNSEMFIKKSIESILNQSEKDFEFIIIDDASTDRTREIIQTFTDQRIVKIFNNENKGLTVNLNHCLHIARGKYIARMDADDISLPQRLNIEAKFLDANEDVYLISSSYREFGKRFGTNRIEMPFEEMRYQFLLGSILPHPGFMFRKELVQKYKFYYNENYKYAQDYDFQFRVSQNFKEYCIPEVLFRYRISEKQISNEKVIEQKKCVLEIRKDIFKYYKIPYSNIEITALNEFAYHKKLNLKEKFALMILLLKIENRIKNEEGVEHIKTKIKLYKKQLITEEII